MTHADFIRALRPAADLAQPTSTILDSPIADQIASELQRLWTLETDLQALIAESDGVAG